MDGTTKEAEIGVGHDRQTTVVEAGQGAQIDILVVKMVGLPGKGNLDVNGTTTVQADLPRREGIAAVGVVTEVETDTTAGGAVGHGRHMVVDTEAPARAGDLMRTKYRFRIEPPKTSPTSK